MTKEQQKPYRDVSKTMVFAALYELPDKLAFAMSKRLNIKEKQAEAIVGALFGKFKGLRGWMSEQLRRGRLEGGVWTQWEGAPARFRPLWNLGATGDGDRGRRESDERSCWNTPIQGKSADYVTASLYPVVQECKQRWPGQADVVMTVYDSILVHCREELVPAVGAMLGQEMTKHDNGPVLLVVDLRYGPSWGSMVDLKP